MSHDMNEFVKLSICSIGNALQMIVFYYFQNDKQIFRALSFVCGVLQELLFVMVLVKLISVVRVKRYVSKKVNM